MFRQAGMVLALGSIFALGSAMPPAWAHGTTERVNVSSGGIQANGLSVGAALSANGRFVAFASIAANLVPGDTNGWADVFLHDRQTGTTKRVSVRTGGSQGNEHSQAPAISANGRFIAFMSYASNLVSGDTNGASDVFLHDLKTGTTKRVSVRTGGSQGNDDSYYPSLSADGRFVAFWSPATNLAPSDTNGESDVFLHDLKTGTTKRVSVRTDGSQGNDDSLFHTLSADGRFIAFMSYASNLASGDTNGASDVFLHDLKTGTTKRVSVRTDGGQGNGDSYAPALSADGRFVAFQAGTSNLISGDTNSNFDVFLHDLKTGTTKRVSVRTDGGQGNGDSYQPAISAGGRFVAFWSDASNLVPGDTNGAFDAFVHDRRTGKTQRVSVSSGGVQGNGESRSPAISAGGRFVAFESNASNLVPGDTNNTTDVFVRTLAP